MSTTTITLPQKTALQVSCKTCKYSWIYQGKKTALNPSIPRLNRFYVVRPKCRYTTKVDFNKSVQPVSKIEPLEQAVGSVSQNPEGVYEHYE